MPRLHHVFPWQKKRVFCPVTLRCSVVPWVPPWNTELWWWKEEDGLHGLPIQWAVGICCPGRRGAHLNWDVEAREEQDPAANRSPKFSSQKMVDSWQCGVAFLMMILLSIQMSSENMAELKGRLDWFFLQKLRTGGQWELRALQKPLLVDEAAVNMLLLAGSNLWLVNVA